jgi:AGZA family xanthine/uracil permease-like MFS transporter
MMSHFATSSAITCLYRNETAGMQIVCIDDALAYTLVVTPSILSQVIYLQQPGDLFGQLVFATAVVSGISTLLMGCFANYPFALAPGMGLNSLFAFSIVINLKLDWHLALAAVLLQGLLMIALSLSHWRERLIAAIPNSLKYATVAGIGLFVAYIALSGDPAPPSLGMGIVVASDATKTTLGSFRHPVTLTALFGLMFTAAMMVRRVKGGMLWGILSTALVGWALGVAPWPQGMVALPHWPGDIFGQAIAGFSYLTFDQLGNFIAAVFILTFITVLDSVGAMVGLSQQLQAPQETANQKQVRSGKAMLALGWGNTVGAIMGVSPVVPYLESAAGISEGGRSGLSSFVTAGLLLVSILFIPFLSAVRPLPRRRCWC